MINNRIPLYVQVKNYILKQIESGNYQPNMKIPTEKELMAQLNVGRATVRAALAELEHEDKIIKRHGIGTFVGHPQKSYSFEPFISLTYSLKKMGIEIRNIKMLSEAMTVHGELLKGWAEGTTVGHLKRLRVASGMPVAIEDSYFTKDIFEIIKKADPSESIAHIILSHPDLDINRVEMNVEIREASAEEKTALELKKGGRVAHMTRWVYSSEKSEPVNYLDFVMPEEIMKKPF